MYSAFFQGATLRPRLQGLDIVVGLPRRVVFVAEGLQSDLGCRPSLFGISDGVPSEQSSGGVNAGKHDSVGFTRHSASAGTPSCRFTPNALETQPAFHASSAVGFWKCALEIGDVICRQPRCRSRSAIRKATASSSSSENVIATKSEAEQNLLSSTSARMILAESGSDPRFRCCSRTRSEGFLPSRIYPSIAGDRFQPRLVLTGGQLGAATTASQRIRYACETRAFISRRSKDDSRLLLEV